MAAIQLTGDVVAKLVPGGERRLAQVPDKELLANTRRLVGKSNQLFAALLLHLAEVETRRLHRTRLCASLYTYCIYELRFSEDAAARRSSAARLVKEFPILFDAIESGELHLTGLLMIGPHLTPENHVEVLGRAKFRTKKELGKLVRELCPLPQVPDLMQPLGPVPTRANPNPSWETFIESFCPPVRELRHGERPRDWANDGGKQAVGDGLVAAASESVSASSKAPAREEADVAHAAHEEAETLPVGPVPSNLPPVTGPQQYQLQFSTVEEHVQLVERAKALMAKSKPGVSLGALHLEAMKLLVAALEKRRFAVTDRPRTAEKSGESVPRQRGDQPPPSGAVPSAEAGEREGAGRDRSRHIPAAERRTVYQRDGGRCTFVDEHGARCRETHYLEIHHLKAFIRDGASTADNLTLRCAAHNALAAEQDFGRELIASKRDSVRHEPLRHQVAAPTRSNRSEFSAASAAFGGVTAPNGGDSGDDGIEHPSGAQETDVHGG